jgi:hypothetical protein
MFDLNQCKVGDRLVNGNGKLCVYTGKDVAGLTTATFPHAVRDENRLDSYVYTDEGRFFPQTVHEWDIVGFAAKPKRVLIRKAKPVNKLLGLLEYVQEQGSNVATHYSSDYIYGWFDKEGKHVYYGYEYKTLPYKATVGLETGKPVTVHTLNNFKGAVTKLLKGAK